MNKHVCVCVCVDGGDGDDDDEDGDGDDGGVKKKTLRVEGGCFERRAPRKFGRKNTGLSVGMHS